MKTILDLVINKLPISTWISLFQLYGKRIFEFGFRLIQIYIFILILLISCAAYSTYQWLSLSVKNKEYEKELIEKQHSIDSIGIYRNLMTIENDKLRIKIMKVQSKIDSLESKLIKELKNDEKNITDTKSDSDAEALGKFTKRYGNGSVRYKKVRVNANSNNQTNKHR